MKKLALIVACLVALALAALLAPALLDNPGRVVIDLGAWRLEMSVLVLAGLVLALWIGLSLIIALFRLPGRAVRRARAARSRRQLENGFLALAEGDWRQAERHLQRALDHRPSTAGYLAAARAAEGQADAAGRDRWLALADGRFGRRHFATGLARARMLVAEGRASDAIPVLERLHLRKPGHQGVLRLLLQAYQDAGRWRDLRLLTPALFKADIVDARRRDELAVHAGVRELEQTEHVAALESAWRALPRRQRSERDLVLAYARRAAELGRAGLAGAQLKRLLDTDLDSEALRVYALVEGGDRPGRIRDCRRWLQDHPDHPGLHLALGMMLLDERDYDEARGHLEKSLARQPDAEAYALLGRILDRSGRLEAAAQCYRNALRIKSGRSARTLPPPAIDQDTGADAEAGPPAG
ncbi:MAG: heme biosynthesis HemY N-terminal domain-containing protein [Wenzhouxiangella sp.]